MLTVKEVKMSDLKCEVTKGAIPMSRLIGKNKLDQLKNKFNGSMDTSKPKKKRGSNSLDKIAINKQKQSQAIMETRIAEAKAKKAEQEAKKKAKETKTKDSQ